MFCATAWLLLSLMSAKGPHRQGIAKTCNKNLKFANLPLPDFSMVTNAAEHSHGALQKRKKSLPFYVLQHYPATSHYIHHGLPSQVLKNSLGHSDLSYFVILSFSLTTQVLQAASLDQVILWRLSPFVLYLSFAFSQVLGGSLKSNLATTCFFKQLKVLLKLHLKKIWFDISSTKIFNPEGQHFIKHQILVVYNEGFKRQKLILLH